MVSAHPLLLIFHLELLLRLFGNNFLTTNIVPLHNQGGIILRKRIIGTLIMSNNLCGGIPERWKKFKYSVIIHDLFKIHDKVNRFVDNRLARNLFLNCVMVEKVVKTMVVNTTDVYTAADGSQQW